MALPPNKSEGGYLHASEFNDLLAEVAGKATAADVAGKVDTANASPALVQATGSSTPSSLAARVGDVVWATDLGVTMDGTTDDTTAVRAAIAAAMTLGKELRFPAGTCRCDGQILPPNDGATPPLQKPLRIVGSGATWNGRGATTGNGGTVFDWRYAGTRGKLVSSGLGLFDISGITFIDGGGGTLPWIYTTNTTVHVHGNGFIGSKTGTACDQDAIVLGGNTQVQGGGGLDDGFQGYGSIIRDNYFNRTRRAVYGRTFANAVVIRDNTIWSGSGSNLAGGAAIEFDNVAAGATEYDTGNVITGNLIEISNYPYAIKLGRATQNTVSGNNVFDPTATSVAAVRCEASALYNLIIDGFVPGSILSLSDASPSNTHLSPGQGVALAFANAGAVTFTGSDLLLRNGVSVPLAHGENTTAGSETYQKIGGTAAAPATDFYLKPVSVAAENAASFKYYGTSQFALQLLGATFNAVESPNGDLKMRVKSGSTLWLGDLGSTSLYWQESTKTLVVNNAAGKIALGSVSGPTITTGSAVPSAAENDGSIYLRSGSPNGSMYVRQNGAWVLK